MIFTKYKVNVTNSNSRKSYFLSPLYFQNRHLNTKMRITRQDEFSEFSGLHSDILQVFPYQMQKKMVAIFGETFFCFKLGVCDKTLRISPYIFDYLGYCREHQLRLGSSFCANQTGLSYAMECEQTYHAL